MLRNKDGIKKDEKIKRSGEKRRKDPSVTLDGRE
jgi:hypothetical protein